MAFNGFNNKQYGHNCCTIVVAVNGHMYEVSQNHDAPNGVMIYSGYSEDCITEVDGQVHPDFIADFEPLLKAPDWIIECHNYILNNII